MPRGGRGVPGGRAARRAGGSCGLKGVPASAAAAARLAWSSGGCVRGESRPARCRGKRLSGRRPCRSVGLLAEGASAGGLSGPAVLWEGVRRGKLPGCQGGRLGVESNPCARPGVAVGAPVGVSPPLAAPRPGLPSDAGSVPLSPPSPGQSRSSTSSPPPPPVRARASLTACPPLGLSSSSASRRGSAAVRSPAAPRWCGLPPARSRSSDPARGGRGWFPRLPDVAPRLPVCMGVGPLRPRPPVRPGRIRRRGPWWRVPRVGSVSPSRRLGTGVSLGSDGWPSRFCPRRPPPVRPAPPTALRVFCRSRGSTVAGRFSLRLPLRSSSRLPRARYGRRVPALPGAAVGDPGGEERGEGGRGCGAVVAVVSGKVVASVVGPARRSRCSLVRRGASARARTGAGPPGRGGFPAALSSRSRVPLVPARPRSRPRLARSVPRTLPLACAPYPLSLSLSLRPPAASRLRSRSLPG